MKSKTFKIGTVLLATVIFFSMLSTISGSGIEPSAIEGNREDWFDARWHYRLFLMVNATDYVRNNYPVDYMINFSQWIGGSDVIDLNSIRVLDNGTEIPSQYEMHDDKSGNVIFVMNGTTDPMETRNYTVYFDTEANGLKPVPDYGEPDYVTEYQEIYKGLGSSPFNGSNDDWWFPPYLDGDQYEYQDYFVGDVKATWNAWGDAWDAGDSKWVRQYAKAVAYRDSFNVYVETWSNDTDPEKAWGSGLLNFSTGSPDDDGWDGLDEGLTVITDDWIKQNFTTIFPDRTDWLSVADLLADGDTDTYDTGMLYNDTMDFGYTSGVDNYALVGASENQPLEILQVYYEGNGTIIDPSDYYLDKVPSQREIVFTKTLDDSVQINVTFVRKLYHPTSLPSLQELRVVAKDTTTNYLILYDNDDPTETPYEKPQMGALIFPEEVAASNMVIEFWLNISDPITGDYFVNISANYNEWWYNTSLTPAENHNEQENGFEFITTYMNGSADPEQEVGEIIDSYENPAEITILAQEDAIPISLVVHSPMHAQVINAWTDLPSNPKMEYITINATFHGDTVERLYYKIEENGTEIIFGGVVDVDVDDLGGAELDGKVNIYVVLEDTNGSEMEVLVTIFVPRTFWQSVFSTFGSLFLLLVTFLTSFLSIMGVAAIKKKRAANRSGTIAKMGTG